MKLIKPGILIILMSAFLAALPASGQITETIWTFEGPVFPPVNWQADGAEWSTFTSYSPTHSVKIGGPGASIAFELYPDGLSGPRGPARSAGSAPGNAATTLPGSGGRWPPEAPCGRRTPRTARARCRRPSVVPMK